ncbi:transcriptional regulator, LysR family [Tistlia consotensis]|uniref:Transcriptional regulator, LysR family n=1 Tax=Tistlia consotensis USBA 355 TaxID=560819 RepID=A0A1Y6CNW4_9PROT|nr:LysR family transcriptional regulator [Tistlia consotensis]SMF79148.1 transcriptional regulator, LysR family [Tistlia consotensis USBA 355]SNS15942.1 transcriptional regulator, LysR family [Tistlia consotensis]
MKIEQLETFRWVARLGSFTKAAARQNATQSTVSTRIAELEHSLGARLLDRSRRQVRLTPKGRDLLSYADAILALVAEARLTVGDPAALTGGLRVGVAELVALTWLPAMVSTFHEACPRIQLDLEIGLTDVVLERLVAGEIDVGIVGLSHAPPDGFAATPIGETAFGFLAAPSMALPAPPLDPAALKDVPIISLGPGAEVARLQDDWFRAGRVAPQRFNSSSSIEISAGLARAGLGVALLPVAYFASDLERGSLVRLAVEPPPPPVRFFALHAPGGASTLASRLAEIARRSARASSWRAAR